MKLRKTNTLDNTYYYFPSWDVWVLVVGCRGTEVIVETQEEHPMKFVIDAEEFFAYYRKHPENSSVF